MSAGVCIKRNSGLMNAKLKAVKITDMIIPAIILVAYDWRTPFISWAPKRWAVIIDIPELNPCTNPITKNWILPVAPTAASDFTPSVCPTTNVSEMLYNCCTKYPITNGMVNIIINFAGFPFVKSCMTTDIPLVLLTLLIHSIETFCVKCENSWN